MNINKVLFTLQMSEVEKFRVNKRSYTILLKILGIRILLKMYKLATLSKYEILSWLNEAEDRLKDLKNDLEIKELKILYILIYLLDKLNKEKNVRIYLNLYNTPYNDEGALHYKNSVVGMENIFKKINGCVDLGMDRSITSISVIKNRIEFYVNGNMYFEFNIESSNLIDHMIDVFINPKKYFEKAGCKVIDLNGHVLNDCYVDKGKMIITAEKLRIRV